MADDAPQTPEQSRMDGRARAMAALRANQIKPGERRNPHPERNGRRKVAEVQHFLEEPSDTDGSKTKFRRLVEVAYIRALKGADVPLRTLLEYHLGKTPISPNEWRLALAEHFRKVEADRFQFARELLGEKIKSMSPVQLAEFFSQLAPDVLGFLKMAEQATAGAEQPQLEASPPAHAAPGEPAPARPADSPDPETARPGDDAGKEPDGRQDAPAHATRDTGDPTP